MLDGLGLIHDGKVPPRASRYAGAVLERLKHMQSGEVPDRSALLVAEYIGAEH